ncbi:hypothetical protein MACH17_15690 [Phaeobacter inhibens]|uniref:P-loop NTPase fold protein n=1 Tax=Phaeobacter inhibens TaxID=221822 RepID=UPI002768FBD6|nr:P-loop NTPase fold protein [Phaeobacter inhibens]GLO70052.1 hypothetical protein MACH17_15690 [Phaeobacter inhibens]
MKHTPEFQKLDEEISLYLSDENTDRALVLYAAWGSGKTHLMNEWLDHRRKNRPYTPGMIRKDQMDIAYISAFGVRTAEELHEKAVAAFIELAPKKNIVLGSRIILTAAASRLNLALPVISNSTLLKFIARPKAIIIDDVERSFGNLGRIFGAINEFIEQHKVKVILICDRSKLEQRIQYVEIEKIADTIIPFPTNPEETSKAMILETVSSVGERYRLQDEIEEAVEHSGTKNVRTVAKALGTYRRLCKAMEQNQPENDENLGKLAYAIVAYAIEFSQQKLSEDVISEVGAISFNPDERSKVQKVMQHYTKFDVTSSYELPLSPDLIKEVVIDNCFDARVVADKISTSRFFSFEEPEEWEIIYHMSRVDREVVEKAITDQQNKIDNMSYKDTGVLLHVFSNKLRLSERGISSESFSDIENEAKSYIEKLAKMEDVEFHLAPAGDNIYRMMDQSYWGLSYPMDSSDPVYACFSEIKKHLVEVLTIREKLSFYQGAHDLFSDIAVNYSDCRDAITAQYPDRYSSEFLHNLDEDLIAKQICDLPNSRKYEFMLAIGSRLYRQIYSRPNETEWCKRLGDKVVKRALSLHPLDKASAEQFAKHFLIRVDREEG